MSPPISVLCAELPQRSLNLFQKDSVVENIISRDPRDVGWLKKNIPCRTYCPALTDIPGYIDAIVKGDYSRSYEINRRDNIFPGILGRVCTRPCEPPCRHGYEGLGKSVSICYLKRVAWDFGRFDVSKVWEKASPSGRRVAVVGSGPAGLAAGNELVLQGHEVTVFEKEEIPGGMMTLGIPQFRLPLQVTEFDIQSVLSLGIELKTSAALGRDISLEELSADYDAVVVALGTMDPIKLGIPGEEGEGVFRGLDFMMDVNGGNSSPVPERVLVVGGGFTAVDCVRSAVRLGARDVSLIYRRTQVEMDIEESEIEEMEVEGMREIYLSSPLEVIRNGNGDVEAVKCVRNKLGKLDKSGRKRPVPIPGSEFILEADMLIAAIGQRAEAGLLGKFEREATSLGNHLEESNIFFAGDFRGGASSIIEAVADGKIAAEGVHRYLTGMKPFQVSLSIEERPGPGTGRERSFDFIERQEMPTLELKKRLDMEGEVQLGFDREKGETEGKRCYLCNHDYQIHIDRCIYCSACIEAMPRKCILLASDVEVDEEGSMHITESEGWEEVSAVVIDNVECIRCGNCIKACPVDCISVAHMEAFTERED